jgi:hypothetical protein
MKWKKYGIFFGVVAIVLLMTSSAIAVNIDSNIKIPTGYVPKLNKALKSIDDVKGFEDFRTLLQGIIDFLQDPENPKKVVNSADIQKIIDDNSLAVSGVYGVKRISGSGPGGHGPHIIRPYYYGGFMRWIAQQSANPHSSISVTVGPDTYTSEHQGLVIGFFGCAFDSWGWDSNHGVITDFGIYSYGFSGYGFGFLIFVGPI